MAERWKIYCDSADIAAWVASQSPPFAPWFEAIVQANPLQAVAQSRQAGAPSAAIVTHTPKAAELMQIAHNGTNSQTPFGVCITEQSRAALATMDLVSDIGGLATHDVLALLCALRLLRAGNAKPWNSSIRGLHPGSKSMLTDKAQATQSQAGRFTDAGAGLISWISPQGQESVVGLAMDLRNAITALQHVCPTIPQQSFSAPQKDSAKESADILFGPPRALSDPASKKALEAFDLRFPAEELCTSASRAVAEASRIGFPVRVTLTSPDLRVWDHPYLQIDDVRSASHLRQVFQQLSQVAIQKDSAARILGVTVSGSTQAYASLRVRCTSLRSGQTLMQIGFADPHGMACEDFTLTTFPTSTQRLQRTIQRLCGATLLTQFEHWKPDCLGSLLETLNKVAAFVDYFRQQVEAVDINPLAILADGSAEIRQVSIIVGAFYQQTLK